MTEIFINNYRVNLPDDLSLEFNKDNPLFTQSSDYSGQLTLSLRDPYNKRIFSNIQRIDVTKNFIVLPARIVVNNILLVSGSAKVIEISDEEINFQILAGNAEFNNFVFSEDIYINKLDLGRAYEGLSYFRDGSVSGNRPGSEVVVNSCNALRDWAYYSNKQDVVDKFFNTVDKEDCVVLPAKGSYKANLEDASYFYNVPGNDFFVDDRYGTVNKWDQDRIGISYPFAVVPQPYLVVIIEKIIKALGFDLVESDLRNMWTRQIYIPNTRKTLYYANMLPHWTVSTFLTEIEKLLGVVFYFDSKEKKCFIYQRFKEFNLVYLDRVDDSYTVKMDEENGDDISTANIEFDLFENDVIHKFSEEILENAVFRDFNSMNEVEAFFNGSTPNAEKKGTVACCGGLQFILYDNNIREVNQLRDLVRNEESDTITLKCVPPKVVGCPLMYRRGYWRNNETTHRQGYEWELIENDSITKVVVPLVDQKPLSEESEYIDIENVIKELEDVTEEESEEDKLPICVFNHNNIYEDEFLDVKKTDTLYAFGYTHGYNDVRYYDFNNFAVREWDGFLMLNKVEGLTTLYNTTFGNIVFDTRKEYEIKFFDKGVFDSRSTFVIQGKKFKCKTIKYSIDVDGFKDEKIGIFIPEEEVE